MALPTASDNQFPKLILEEVADDGSATPTPAADHRALFLGEDGELHLKDSSGSVSDVTSGGGSQVFPHHAEISANLIPVSGQYDTALLATSTAFDTTRYNSAGALNDEAVWRVPLEAGTYSLAFLHYMRNNRPIYQFAISADGSSWTDIGSSIDGYSSVSSGNGTATDTTRTGLTIASSGPLYLRLKNTSKNGSSAGYVGLYSQITLTRTGA